VFQLWYFAVHPEKAMRPAMDRIIEAGQTYFPGIDKLTRKQQKHAALRFCVAARRDHELMADPLDEASGAGERNEGDTHASAPALATTPRTCACSMGSTTLVSGPAITTSSPTRVRPTCRKHNRLISTRCQHRCRWSSGLHVHRDGCFHSGSVPVLSGAIRSARPSTAL
jgi:hypothetical protein